MRMTARLPDPIRIPNSAVGHIYAEGYEAGLDRGWKRAMAIVDSTETTHVASNYVLTALRAALKIGYKHYKDGPDAPQLVLPEGASMGHCSCDCGHQDAAVVVILTALNQMEERLMTTIDELEASLGAKLAELTKDVQRALDIITAGTLSPAQEAAAAAIQTGIDNLDAAVEAVAPEAAPEPTPEPGTPPVA
jgi:hypothetical protein